MGEVFMSELKLEWRGKNFSYFSHKECEWFPCHQTSDPDDFNCLFCFCPLYASGEACGGHFKYTEKGVKDCSGCQIPHRRENYGKILEKYKEFTNG
jgi:Zn-finger protein